MNMSSYKCCNPVTGPSEITSLASTLKTISEPNRLRILCTLEKGGEHCVCELIEHIQGISQSLLSHHIADLREAELIEGEKRGLKVFYKLTDRGRHITKSILSLAGEGL